jgi:hypothetical protein
MTRDTLPRWNANERGTAFLLALLFIVLLSFGAIAGLSRMSAERRSTVNIEAEVDAYATARAAIGKFMAATTSTPGASLDTTITGLPGGSATVQVRRLRTASGSLPALYVIRAYGIYSSAARYDANMPSAERSVAQFATWEPGTMNVQSAWTALAGLKKSGGSGMLDGADQCTVNPAVAGVAVPVTAIDGGPGYNQNGGSSVPTGSPTILYPAADPTSFASVLPLDWNAIVNGGAIKFDVTLTSDVGWPLLAMASGWPAIYVNNTSALSLSSGNSGHGLLVVRHDLALNGSFNWDGVILVGGALISSGNQTIQGAVVSGLNLKLGETVSTSDVGSGGKTYRYNSCYVKNSLGAVGSLIPMTNARLDNWPGY